MQKIKLPNWKTSFQDRKDGRKWLRRPNLCTKGCRAVLSRRIISYIIFRYYKDTNLKNIYKSQTISVDTTTIFPRPNLRRSFQSFIGALLFAFLCTYERHGKLSLLWRKFQEMEIGLVRCVLYYSKACQHVTRPYTPKRNIQ